MTPTFYSLPVSVPVAVVLALLLGIFIILAFRRSLIIDHLRSDHRRLRANLDDHRRRLAIWSRAADDTTPVYTIGHILRPGSHPVLAVLRHSSNPCFSLPPVVVKVFTDPNPDFNLLCARELIDLLQN